MPAFLTHWRILINTARQSQDAGSDLGSLIVDAVALRRRAHGWSTPPQTAAAGAVWDTGPLPEIDLHFPGSDISALAFLGALAPDLLYYQPRYWRRRQSAALSRPLASATPHWSELFHSSHTGDLLITFLEQVALVPSPALRSQALAFALGYTSHIAADIALNPWIDALVAQLPARRQPGAHVAIEMRLDEYLATSYFEHPRYSLWRQPWGDYIEPAARDLCRADTLVAQLLKLLASAVEIYGLDEADNDAFAQTFQDSLRALRHFLAGRGRGRLLTLNAARRGVQDDLIAAVLADPQSDEVIIALDKVLHYAERLSTHLCRRAINYYTVLRRPAAEASERSSQRTALRKDLRNWDLHTGYSTDDQPPLHNWQHFADLWEAPISVPFPLQV